MTHAFRLLVPALLLLSMACASAPPDAGLSQVESNVTARDVHDVRWRGLDADSVATLVRLKLSEPLTANDAVQVALVNNASLRATLTELGIARGEVIQAGTIANPTLDARVRWSGNTSTVNPELTALFDMTDWLRRSKRNGAAEAEFDATVLRVSHEVLMFAATVRTAFFDAQAARQLKRMTAEVHQAAVLSMELSRRQREAGNINALELATAESALQEARLALSRSETQERLSTQQLAHLMGLSESDTTWSIATDLPGIPDSDPSTEEIESVALEGRLDLQAARREIDAGRRELSYRKSFFIPSLQVGVDAERDFDGEWAYGPIVELSVPIFDRGQGGVEIARARLRRAEFNATATEVAIRYEVRSASDRLRAAREAVMMYRDHVIPTREKVVEETQRHYNFMLSGPMTLLQAKRDEIDAYRGYIEAVRDYWTARTELERAAAAQLVMR